MGVREIFFVTYLPPNKKIIGGLDVFTNRVIEEMLQDREFLRDFLPTIVCFKGRGRRRKINGIKVVEFKYDDSKDMIENNDSFKLFLQKMVGENDILLTHDWFGILSKGRRISVIHSLEHHRSLILAKEENYIRKEERGAIDGAEVVITVSNLMAQEIEECYARDSDVIYPSYSLPFSHSSLSSSSSLTSEGRINILFVGRLERQKNVENLIKAVSLLDDALRDRILLNIVGEGSMELKLKKYASYLKLNDVVKFHGWVSSKILIRLYSNSHLFVLPSYFEPFGISCYDAYLYNLPIISTRNAGCLELLALHNYKKIRTFDPFIPYTIAEAMEDEIRSILSKGIKKEEKSEKVRKIREWKDVWVEMKDRIYELS